MATPIIVNPTKPSQVVVGGTQKSGTPITINTDLDYTRVQSMIDESLGGVKIDTTDLAKQGDNPEATNTKILEETLKVSDKIDNIKLPEIDTTELAKEATLNEVSSKLDNLNVEVDLSNVAQQGENQEATNSKILDGIERILARSAKYDTATGNLQFDNIDLTIV